MSAAKAPAGGPSITGYLPALLPLACVAGFALLLPGVMADGGYRVAWDWVPGLDVALSFRIDGLALLFALMISGIGVFIFLYAGAYMAGHPQFWRFFLYLGGFMLAMLGLVTADNLIALFVFWELTSVTSYLLIGFNHEDAESRRKALQALIVTGAGGLAMLAGFLVLGLVGGSFEISELDRIAVQQSELYVPILVLVLLGAFTKSAQFPFHFWLPNAMAAPTPVSAFLHSATMVKAGIYLLARLHPTLGETDLWVWTLTIFGAITAVWASVLALRQTDLKAMLAYTTLMALGTLTMFLGAESEVALTAVGTFIVVHGLYKAALFMVVGILDHEAGSRFLPDLAGLGRKLPVTAAAAAAAAFSMAGFPPFLGFIGKELKYKGALAVASEPVLVATAAVAANAMMVGVALVVALRPFWGRPERSPAPAHEAPWGMWIGPVVLAILGLVFGLFPERVAAPIVVPAVEAIRALPGAYPLELWHGINLPLMMSIGTVALGALLYWQFDRVAAGLRRALAPLPSGDGAYDRIMAGMLALATWQSRLLQNGRQRRYVFVVFATLTVGVAGTLIVKDGIVLPDAVPVLAWYKWLIAAILVAATLVTVIARSRLTAIGALGVIGTGIALIFVIYGAPDVAMTQLMVEILIVVIVAVVLLRLPGFRAVDHPGRAGRLRDAALAIATGTTVTLMLLSVSVGPIDRRLTTFFEENSVPGGFGHNIVNVILVDFRAIDTFGEIAVVAIAGLACWALIRLRPRRPDRTEDGVEPAASSGD